MENKNFLNNNKLEILDKILNKLIKDSKIIFDNKNKELFNNDKEIIDKLREKLDSELDFMSIKSKIFKNMYLYNNKEPDLKYMIKKVVIPTLITPYFKAITIGLHELNISSKNIKLNKLKEELSDVLILRTKRYLFMIDKSLSDKINLDESDTSIIKTVTGNLKDIYTYIIFLVFHIANSLIFTFFIKALVNKLLSVPDSIFTIHIKNLILFKPSEFKKLLSLPKIFVSNKIKSIKVKSGIGLAIILAVAYFYIETKLVIDLLKY